MYNRHAWTSSPFVGNHFSIHCHRWQVTEDIEEMRFNTGISAMMEFVNGAYKWEGVPKAAIEPFILLLSPFAPHIAEELWQVSLEHFWYNHTDMIINLV